MRTGDDAFRRGLLGATAACTSLIAGSALAQTLMFKVPAQPAETGVTEFARQAGVQILVARDATIGRKTGAVVGALSLSEGLSRLLAGADLVVVANDGRTIILAQPRAGLIEARLAQATPFAVTALAEADGDDRPARTAEVQEVVVTGKRVSEAKAAIGTDKVTATVAITREALLSAPAGITGLKMLESLPGFNVQANDALGLYEFGNSVNVRAFQLSQIGFVLDNIPMGRSDQFGGSPIYRYVDNETTARLTASSGAGDVSLPSYASLGPIVQYTTLTPSRALGVTANATVGSNNLSRYYGRFEMGDFHGLTGYAAASWLKGDNWRSPGDSQRRHYEGKLRYELPNGGDVTLQATHNEYQDYDSPDISKAQYNALGRDVGYLGYVPAPTGIYAPTTPGITYSSPYYSYYYKFATNERVDHLYGLTLQTPVTDKINVIATGYYEDKGGFGVSPDYYANSLAKYNTEKNLGLGVTPPLGVQYGRSKINGDRAGFVGRGEFKIANNDISAGVWLETDVYHRLTARYNLTNGAPDGTPLLNEVVFRRRDYKSDRMTDQFFVKDVIGFFDDALKFDIGFKTLNIDYNMKGYRDFTDYWAGKPIYLSTNWHNYFLPQIGVVYNINSRDQIFSSYSEQMALPHGADDNFSLTSLVSTPSKPDTVVVPSPKAETSKNIEFGYRANRPTFNGSVAIYGTQFDNRLEAYASLVPGSVSSFDYYYHNVGSVRAYGVEFSGQWKPQIFAGKIFLSSNFSYNHSTFQNNAPDLSGITIKGKTTPDSPYYLIQGAINYQPESWAIFNLSAKYVGKRYSNYDNSEQIDGYTILNAYVDFGDGYSLGILKQIKGRLNIDNILDTSYLGTIDGAVVTGPAQFRPGPARTVEFTLSAAF